MSVQARHVLLLGATGLIGRHCLTGLLADSSVAKLIAPTRRALDLREPKLENPVIDFAQLETAFSGLALDQVICCLGTTIKQAGSQDAFRVVDYEYPMALARAAKAAGARHYLVVTAAGSNVGSRVFYNRVKGELERDLRTLKFPALTIARPSLLLGERDTPRLGETLAAPLAKLLPRRWRAIEGKTVAQALIVLARAPATGVRMIESSQLLDFA